MEKQKQTISVLMPTYNYSAFISRAINSLLRQYFQDWELIIINDGSTDHTADLIRQYKHDIRCKYIQLPQNEGLGAALNRALAEAHGQYIAYLPSDDIYYQSHLSSLLKKIKETNSFLVYSGVRHHYNKTAEGIIEGSMLQLVQVLHKKGKDKWLERNELVTDDLNKMYWDNLRLSGTFSGTSQVTCEWVDHPAQRHKIIQEPLGGINPYRVRYSVQEPLRFKSTVGNFIDEGAHFRQFRERPDTPMSSAGLKILLVGELAYNPERVLALEERGHKLYGLWMRDPYWYNWVGPQPFGHIQDISYHRWQDEIKKIKPDIIYALLNWQAVPFVHEILQDNPSIPFVWHFKEGPFICLEKGMWNSLIEIYNKSDGQIYVSEEMRNWFRQFLVSYDEKKTYVLDGDLPKQEWFSDNFSQKLSQKDGEIHTVVPGRPIGLHPSTVEELGKQSIHLHFYGDFTHGQWREWIQKTQSLAPQYLHIHANVDQENWVEEFSQYDAGWLHFFESNNNGEIGRSNWDDLNIPARMSTLACAGLPMLQRDNQNHTVATQTLARRYDISIFFNTIDELAEKLQNKIILQHTADMVMKQRKQFCFDSHADDLIAYFRYIIASKK